MVIEHEELKTLVPHSRKMLIIDRISNADYKNWLMESETKITEDFMFYDKKAGGVPDYACFEMIAQTVAALTGLYTRENNLPPNMGMILSVTNLSFSTSLIKDGQTVKIRAVREGAVEKVYTFRAEVFVDEEKIGSGKLTVMEMSLK